MRWTSSNAYIKYLKYCEVLQELDKNVDYFQENVGTQNLFQVGVFCAFGQSIDYKLKMYAKAF